MPNTRKDEEAGPMVMIDTKKITKKSESEINKATEKKKYAMPMLM